MSCYKGYFAHGGSRGVGRAATEAVISSVRPCRNLFDYRITPPLALRLYLFRLFLGDAMTDMTPTPVDNAGPLIRIRDLKKSFGSIDIERSQFRYSRGSLCGFWEAPAWVKVYYLSTCGPPWARQWRGRVDGEDLVPMRGKELQAYRRKIGKVFKRRAV